VLIITFVRSCIKKETRVVSHQWHPAMSLSF